MYTFIGKYCLTAIMVCQEIFLKKAYTKTSPILVVIFTQGGEDCEDIWYGERKPRDDKGLRVHHHHQRVLQPHDGGLHRLRWNIWGKTIFRCLGQRRVLGPGVQLGLPRCPTIAPLRSSASSRSRKMSVSTNIAESDLGNSKLSIVQSDKYYFLSTSIYSYDFVFWLPPRHPWFAKPLIDIDHISL